MINIESFWNMSPVTSTRTVTHYLNIIIAFKIEYHAVGDTWWDHCCLMVNNVQNSRSAFSFIIIKHCI